MNNGLIPRRYAKALYKFAVEKGNTEKVYEEMKTVVASFNENPTLQKVLSNPFVERAEKAKLLELSAGERLEDDYRGFVKLILDHNREEYARLMAMDFCALYREENKIARVKITTAAPLDKEMEDKITAVAKNAYKDYKLEFETSVDPSLIGGFIIDVDDSRLDSSISNEIEQLRLNLLRSN